ncbi:MAG: hypothetical protein ABUK01_18705 [Leptospirales bacterium]
MGISTFGTGTAGTKFAGGEKTTKINTHLDAPQNIVWGSEKGAAFAVDIPATRCH